MSKLKLTYNLIGVSSMILGTVLILNSQLPIVGAVVGVGNLSSNSSLGWAAFFLASGIALFYTQIKKP